MAGLKVVKEGGWCFLTPENTKKSLDFVLQDSGRRVLVPSGPKGLTDRYIGSAEERILLGSATRGTYDTIMDKWRELCSGLDLMENCKEIESRYREILNSYDGPRNLDDIRAKRFIDDVARLGETFEAESIVAPLLNRLGANAVSLSPVGLITGTDNPGDASILPDQKKKLRRRINELLETYHIVVLHGYYCSTRDGQTIVTLHRGGSDTTGSHAAAELGAALYENCSDGPIRRADPRVVKDAMQLEKITYEEALGLSHMGADILQHEAIKPCWDNGIPISVIDIFNPDRKTEILKYREPDKFDITGVTHRKGYVDITVRNLSSRLTSYNLLRQLGIHTRRDVYPSTSLLDVSIVIPGEKLTDRMIHDKLKHVIRHFRLHDNDIEVRYNISLISVIGKYMRDREAINARAASALASHGLSTSNIFQGGSEVGIHYGIQEATKDPIKAQSGVRAIYNEFFVDNFFGKVIEERKRELQKQNSI